MNDTTAMREMSNETMPRQAYPLGHSNAELARLVGLVDPSEKSCRTCHDASQLRLKPPIEPDCARVCPLTETPPPSPSFETWPSYSTPAGVVPKTNPF